MSSYLTTTETVLGRFLNRATIFLIINTGLFVFERINEVNGWGSLHVSPETVAAINVFAYIGYRAVRESADPRVPAVVPPPPPTPLAAGGSLEIGENQDGSLNVAKAPAKPKTNGDGTK